MKIVISGTGYVGLTTGVCFAEIGYNVVCVDVDTNRVKTLKEGKSPIYEEGLEELMQKNYKAGRIDYTTDYKLAYKDADVIFIGVGTPKQLDGTVNLNDVMTVIKQIAKTVEKNCVIVIKSTVPVGTGDKIEALIKKYVQRDIKIEVANNPEFLSQGTAIKNIFEAERIIIGTENEKVKKLLRDIYKPFNAPMVFVDRRTSEMIKYASNSFLALKISYINEIANLCEKVGANVQDVAKGMGYDKRIGKYFLKSGIGYGGSCFSKDTEALRCLAKQNKCRLKTVEATIDTNETQKIILYKKAYAKLKTFQNLKVAVLGLTFKPETDDIREAPAIYNVKLLLEQGAKIYAYDPIGIENFKKIFLSEITYVTNPEQALEKADVCFIFTEWKQIKEIKPSTYKNLMKIPLIYDGRNIYNIEKMKKANIEYHSIGR